MFEDAKRDLIDALSDADQPLTVDEISDAIGGNAIVAESAVNQFATVEERDGERYVVAVEDGPDFSDAEIDASEGHAEAADGDAEKIEPEPEPDPSPSPEPSQTGAQGASWEADDDLQVYEVNGLRITVDPARELVGEPTGEDWYGLPILENGDDRIPESDTPYFPVEVAGNRDSEEVMGRVLGERVRPLLFEGEAGTGKNAALDRVASATNRLVQRINFGSDISVFDLVGEKDIVDGESVYILGKGAKAAMFGHVAVFDEVNMATGDVTSFLHAVTEEVGNRQVELRGTDVTLTDVPVSEAEIERYGSWYDAARAKWDPERHVGKHIHPEFRITGTCNPLTYAGTKSMNDAFRDRFVVVPHPYLDADQEAALLAEETGAQAAWVRDLVELANILREAREEGNAISCPITHRALLKTVEMAGPSQEFMSFREAAEIVMVEHASTKQDKQYIADAIEDEL